MFLFIVFGLPAKFFQNFGDNISVHLSKLHFTCPYEEFEKNFLFGKVKLNFIFLNWKKISSFVEKKEGSSKLHSTCQEERLEEKHFFRKNYFFKSFFPWPKKNQFLGWKYLCEQIKLFRSFSDFQMKQSGTKAKKPAHNLFIVFWLYLQKNIQKWRQTFWLTCQWFNLSVQGNNLREVIFWRRTKFFKNFVLWAKRFRNFDKKFLQGCQNWLLRVWINVLRNFSKKYHFFSTSSENEQETIQLWAETFRQVFQKFSFEVSR